MVAPLMCKAAQLTASRMGPVVMKTLAEVPMAQGRAVMTAVSKCCAEGVRAAGQNTALHKFGKELGQEFGESVASDVFNQTSGKNVPTSPSAGGVFYEALKKAATAATTEPTPAPGSRVSLSAIDLLVANTQPQPSPIHLEFSKKFTMDGR